MCVIFRKRAGGKWTRERAFTAKNSTLRLFQPLNEQTQCCLIFFTFSIQSSHSSKCTLLYERIYVFVPVCVPYIMRTLLNDGLAHNFRFSFHFFHFFDLHITAFILWFFPSAFFIRFWLTFTWHNLNFSFMSNKRRRRRRKLKKKI